MPIYEFICQRCGNKFSLLLSMAKKAEAACPSCRSKELKEDYSGYGAATVKKSAAGKFT